MSYVKLNECKFCSLLFEGLTSSGRANHTRWCEKNPKIVEYKEKARAGGGNKGNQFTKAKSEGRTIVSALKGTSTVSRPHTQETKELIREKALASDHRRLRRKMISYQRTDGTCVMLDSSWEEALAMRLDELKVEWVRPGPIKYVGKDGKEHNYFPDFYLPKYDILLDPKNNAAYNAQKDKIEILLTQLTNLRILHSLVECKNFAPVA